jgi:hypothetical protein
MAHLFTLVALYFLSVSQTVLGSPCIAFDANWNLYALGLNGKDYNVATQDKWTGSKCSICSHLFLLTNSICVSQAIWPPMSQQLVDRKLPTGIDILLIRLN